MIWELIGTGHLAHWWEYVMLVACVLVLAGGPALIWLLWVTSPRRGGKWWLARGSFTSGSR